jgi:DNA-binding transcriptional regulator YdaS (Cro superfamily)
MPKKKYRPSKRMQKEGMEAMVRAIEISGGVTKLALLIGVSRQMIFHWKTGNQIITVERAIQVEEKLKGQIKFKDLRPDVFDKC